MNKLNKKLKLILEKVSPSDFLNSTKEFVFGRFKGENKVDKITPELIQDINAADKQGNHPYIGNVNELEFVIPYLISDEDFKAGYCYDGEKIIYYNGDYGEKRAENLKKIEFNAEEMSNCLVSMVESDAGKDLRSVGRCELKDLINIILANDGVCELYMSKQCKPGCLNLVLNGENSQCCGDTIIAPSLQMNRKVIVI